MKKQSKAPVKKSNAVSKLVAEKNKAIAEIIALAKPVNTGERKSLRVKLEKKSLSDVQTELAHAKKAAKAPAPKVSSVPNLPAGKSGSALNLNATAPITKAGRFNKKHNPPKAAPVAPAPKPVAPVMPPPAPAPVTPDTGFALPASVPPPPAIGLELAPDAISPKGKTRKRYVSKTDENSKYHLRDRSEAEKPVSIVRRTCEAMPNATRKEVIEACIKAGVNINTAATQYSLWKAAKRVAAALADQGDTGEGDVEE